MRKILSIKEMEDFLLQGSTLQDIKCVDRSHPVQADPNQKMTKDQVQHEISVLARTLIRAYAGWPAHNDIIKRKVLVYLTRLYKNADDMTVGEFAKTIKQVVSYIPDNHLNIAGKRIQTKRKRLNVGKNIAGTESFHAYMRDDNIGVIGFSTMSGDYKDKEKKDSFIKNYIDKTSALIIDLRGNGGGNNKFSDELAYYLCGAPVASAKKNFIRTTPEACKIHIEYKREPECAKFPKSEKLTLFHKGTCFKINKKTAYKKPIYILTDAKTCSSAEMFLLRMLHHPMVTVVGDNSGGMEVFGYMAQTYLPTSKLIIRIGMRYRVLEYDNFELHGYKPDIKCKDGQDALLVALSAYTKQFGAKKLSQSRQK